MNHVSQKGLNVKRLVLRTTLPEVVGAKRLGTTISALDRRRERPFCKCQSMAAEYEEKEFNVDARKVSTLLRASIAVSSTISSIARPTTLARRSGSRRG